MNYRIDQLETMVLQLSKLKAFGLSTMKALKNLYFRLALKANNYFRRSEYRYWRRCEAAIQAIVKLVAIHLGISQVEAFEILEDA